jgi:hypothetical protein
MIPAPRIRDPILLFLLAAFLVAAALKITWLPDWIRTALLFGAAIFGTFGVISTLNYLAYLTGIRIREINRARLEGTLPLAMALQGLTPKQTDIVARHDIIELAGMLGSEGIIWNIKAPGGDIPLDFMWEFLEASIDTEPYLFPVRRHTEISYLDAENLLKISTDLLKATGRAERSSGPYAAKLTTDLRLIAAEFGLEI